MGKKILIVGGVAGGATVAARARRLDEQAEIIMFEKGPHVSFSNCALPYYLSGVVDNSNRLLMMNPTKFKVQYNIDARVEQEVIKIDRENKKVSVKKLQTGEIYEESYDKLVLSPGADPIFPKDVPGADKRQIFTVRNVVDIVSIKEYIDNNNINKITVVGGGFIGIEVAENLAISGKQVTIIQSQNQVMGPFDYDMAQLLHKEISDNKINLILNNKVCEIFEDKVKLTSGIEVETEMLIYAIGVFPNTELAVSAGLEIGQTGGIKVNYNYQTNDPDIYAVGDAIEVFNELTHSPARLPLAGPAQRQARIVADHIYNITNNRTGVIGSSVIKIFNLNAASTGLNERAAKAANIPYQFVYIIAPDKVSIMPDNSMIHFKLLFEYPTGRILGAQAIGKGNVDKRIDVIATMITMGGTLFDLKELELCYSPIYSTARDVVNIAALVGLNVLQGKFKEVPVYAARKLVEENEFILDVREEIEYMMSHIKNSVNLPLSELRQRANELPKDKTIYVYCQTGKRSYNACMALQGLGFDNVVNIAGSFMGIYLYEYYNSKILGRESIFE